MQDNIEFEDFKKIDIHIAEVVQAERVEGSEKLLKVEVKLKDEKRVIVAGIADTHRPEDLEGEQVVVVSNLKPKKIFGIESQGMLLAAEENKEAILLKPEKKVSSGSKIH